MATENYRLIRQAIHNRTQVMATYGGHTREFCPHVLGLKQGVEHVFVYQFGGSSESGLGPPGSVENWRRMSIAALSDLVLVTGSWHSGDHPGKGRESCIDEVDVYVPVGWTARPLFASEAA
jgi:hypothetical protein